MGATSRLLVRYDGGYIYRAAPGNPGDHPVREAYREMGGIKDPTSVEAIADRLLRLSVTPNETRAYSGPVATPEQLPGYGFRLGDRLAGDLVIGYDVRSDADDLTVVTPELIDPVTLELDRIDRQLRRYTNGDTSENSHPTTIDNASGTTQDPTPPTFNQDGPVAVAIGPSWRIPRPYHLSWIEVSVTQPGITPTTVAIANGAFSVGSVTLPAGWSAVVGKIDAGFITGATFTPIVTVAGSGATALVVVPRGAAI